MWPCQPASHLLKPLRLSASTGTSHYSNIKRRDVDCFLSNTGSNANLNRTISQPCLCLVTLWFVFLATNQQACLVTSGQELCLEPLTVINSVTPDEDPPPLIHLPASKVKSKPAPLGVLNELIHHTSPLIHHVLNVTPAIFKLGGDKDDLNWTLRVLFQPPPSWTKGVIQQELPFIPPPLIIRGTQPDSSRKLIHTLPESGSSKPVNLITDDTAKTILEISKPVPD